MAHFLHTVSYVVLPLMLAVVLHEYAHGWVARYYGDDTALRHGRLTLNPLAHIDRFGTILVPLLCIALPGGFLMGWAKPVPVTPGRLRRPRRDMALVAAAGPAMNFALALLSGVMLNILLAVDPTLQDHWPPQPGIAPRTDLLGMLLVPLAAMTLFSMLINTVLFAVNLLPIPPLDGGRIVLSSLPPRPARALGRLEPYGMLILLGLLMLDAQIPVFSIYVGTIIHTMSMMILVS